MTTKKQDVEPYVGMTCQHFMDRGAEPSAGLVVAVGSNGNCDIQVFYPQSMTPASLSGVPHIDNPNGSRYQKDEPSPGYWDYCPPAREDVLPPKGKVAAK